MATNRATAGGGESDSTRSGRCVEQLKVLADTTRLEVLRQLLLGPMRVGELQGVVDVEQSLLSHHLRVLREAELVVTERDGKSVLYRLSPQVRGSGSRRSLDLGCCRLAFREEDL